MIVSFVWCISLFTGRENLWEKKNLLHGIQTELEICRDLNVAKQYVQEYLPKLRNAVHQTMELVGLDEEETVRYIRAICNYVSGG